MISTLSMFLSGERGREGREGRYGGGLRNRDMGGGRDKRKEKGK